MDEKYVGVITGDLFKSTAGRDRGYSYMKIMDTLTQRLNSSKVSNRYIIESMDFFRGDSFQITLDPYSVIEIATYIRVYLLSLSDEMEEAKYDARMSISINSFNKYSRYNDSVFEKAHIDSGRALDSMPKHKMLTFSSDIPYLHASINAAVTLLDALLNNLSKPQADVLRRCIEIGGVNIPLIAEQTSKSRQNIHKIISRSGIDNIMEFINMNRFDINYRLEGSI